jgi:predicted helicase
MFDVPTQIPNLNRELVEQIETKIGIKLDWDALIDISHAKSNNGLFSPTDLLDYIYGVLHSPTYRETYKEFLKIDFPSVPFGDEWMKLVGKTGDVQTEFWRVARLGSNLRKLHLMEGMQNNVQYPIAGSNHINTLRFENGKVWINEEQYFEEVGEVAWNFYIGGYQPAQKWLKDRKGSVLNMEDILHYGQMISTLTMTQEIMKQIDL